jgi:hypothetical protein
VGAALVPVLAMFVEQILGEPLVRRVSGRGVQPAQAKSGRHNFRVALIVGLLGFLIVAGALTLPKLVEGRPLNSTPLFGGNVPVVNEVFHDRDSDGIADGNDNCADVANPDQEDTNNAGRGDACDPDDDNDEVPDTEDNCRTEANPGQEDADGDGLGDACDDDPGTGDGNGTDTDADGDGIPDADDNCLEVANTEQENFDGDEHGDACDDDDDGDGVTDDVDNAPLDPNVT